MTQTHAAAPPTTAVRRLAEQAFSRAAGAPLIGGNRVELLIDGAAHFDAWADAIAGARASVLLENYIIRNDAVGQRLRDLLAERAAAGVAVRVIRDWLGCFGLDGGGFWKPLLDAGGEVRSYNPARFDSPLGWINRDHRKLVVVDGTIGFVSGVCLSAKWLGEPEKNIPPWRDTGVSLHGPAVAELVAAFADVWSQLGAPLSDVPAPTPQPAGDMDVRVIATAPSTAGLFRLDQLIAAMARHRLWLTDAYFVGLPPYVQALRAAALDGVDVRLLVPGASDIPAVARMSRAGYRPLLEAGVRVFEWNGSMLHSKTAVADSRWARVGSSNLNIASWIGNCEIDLAIEDHAFAQTLEMQYVHDLENATEIVLTKQKVKKGAGRRAPQGGSGGSSRAAAGALRLAHSVGAALGNQRVLGRAEVGALPWVTAILLTLGVVAVQWPWLVAWPLAVIAFALGFSLFARYLRVCRAHPRKPPEPSA